MGCLLIRVLESVQMADHGLDSRVGTHAGEFDATVTALGSGTLLLQVKVSQLAAGGLDHADLVGDRVVRLPSPL